MAFCLALIPSVFSQPENVKVLSYSWYTRPSNGDLIVVGEVQNTGPNVIDNITATAIVYTPDGIAQASNFLQAFGHQLLPQQKAPLYVEFAPQNSITGDLSWVSQGIGNVYFWVYSGDPTDSRQYQDLVVSDNTSSVDSSGYCMVTGVVRNTGAQATNRTWVVATFYNATGTVISMGFSDYLTPTSIAPGSTASFTVYAFDSNSHGLAAQITSYTLLIQTSMTAPPATPTEPEKVISIPATYLYVIGAVVAIVLIVAAALTLKKRRRQSAHACS